MTPPTLVRAMGRWTLTAAVVNSVIGSGIFGLPSALVALAGFWSVPLVLLAGACIFVVILCFAEVSSRFDAAGGPYLYAREAYGPGTGFQIGWLLLFGRFLSAAAALNILTVYLAPLLPRVATPAGRAVAMVTIVATVTALNVRGVRTAAWTTNAFTVAKLVPLLILIAVGLTYLSPGSMSSQVVAQPDWADALLLLVFAYGGFEAAVTASEEARDARRDTAFALIAATIGVTVVYALLQLVIVGVLPAAATSSTPIADALGVLMGSAGVTLASVGVVLSVYGWLTGFTLMMPRVLYSMALRGELPSRLAAVHPRYRTPAVAIVTAALIALGMGLASSFGQAAALAAIARLVVFVATCVALIVLRRQPGAPPAAVVVPAGPAFAVAGTAFSLWMLSTRSFDQVWILLAIMGAGAVLRLVLTEGTEGTEAEGTEAEGTEGTDSQEERRNGGERRKFVL